MCFLAVTTLTAGVQGIRNIFWPLTQQPGKEFTGYLDSTLMSIFIVGVVLVLVETVRRCWKTLRGEPIPQEAFGLPEEDMEVRLSCC
jgi:carbon starvation protein CstA